MFNIFSVILLSLSIVPFVFADFEWTDVTPFAGSDFSCIFISKSKPHIVYLGSENAIFVSKDGGKSWRQVLTLRGENSRVNYITEYPLNCGDIFAATNNGLFRSKYYGKGWLRIFKSSEEGENQINMVEFGGINFEKVFLATKSGLLVGDIDSLKFRKIRGLFSNTSINWIHINKNRPDIIWLATDAGVFKSEDSGKNWERVYLSFAEDMEETEEYEELEGSSKIPKVITADQDEKIVYFGTNEGIYFSKDRGSSWIKMTDAGLTNLHINDLLISEIGDTIFAATDNGLFKFNSVRDTWEKLSYGIESSKINRLGSEDKKLWIVAKNRVYQLKINPVEFNPSLNLQANEIFSNFSNEPTIGEIRKVAIEYAEVHPDKIKNWRRQARLKAFVPEFDLGYDKTIQLGGTRGRFGQFAVGPRDWDVSLRWDLADLIWSPAQTSIDVRSRLMVRLRNDILDEVTRLYFARRRLQIRLLTKPAKDLDTLLEKELRIQELTAHIDSLTGGYLSERLKQGR